MNLKTYEEIDNKESGQSKSGTYFIRFCRVVKSAFIIRYYNVCGGTGWCRRWRYLRLGILEVSFLLPLGFPRRELPLTFLALIEREDVRQEALGELFDLVLRDVGVVYELFLTTQCLPPFNIQLRIPAGWYLLVHLLIVRFCHGAGQEFQYSSVPAP